MEIEVELSPVVPTPSLLELARLVDDPRVSRLGISDVALLRDCFQIQSLCAAATSHVLIGSLVTSPYLRHPVAMAAALGTLNEISNGRAFLGIGVGAGLSRLGIDQSRPVRRLEEFLNVVKRLLSGERLTHEGSHYVTRGAALSPEITGSIPVVVGTRSRLVCKLAGRVADAVVVGARELSPSTLAQYREWVEDGARTAGRDPKEVEIAPRVTVCMSEDGDHARRSVVLYAAHYLVIGGIEQSKLPEEKFRRISDLVSQASGWYFEPGVSYPAELDDVVDAEIVDRFAIAGTPSECLQKLRSLREMGYGSVSMNIAAVRRPGHSMYDGLRETLDGLSSVLDQVHAI